MTRTAALIAALLCSTAAQAQDVVVMRRQVAPPNRTAPTPTPTPAPGATPTPTGTPTPTPAPARGTWTLGVKVSLGPACSDTAPAASPVTCNAADGSVLPDDRCDGDKPSGAGTISDLRACTYRWVTGTYGDFTPNCSANATRTRTVTCRRSDETEADAALCDPNSPDARTTDTAGYFGGCGYTPTYGAPGACTPELTGSPDGFRTSALTSCMRSDQTDVTAANAAMAEPHCALTTKVACTLTYEPTFSSTYSVCSGGTQSAPIVSCLRRGSDGTTTSVPTGQCAKQETVRNCLPSTIQNGDFSGSGSWTFPTATASITGGVGRVNLNTSGYFRQNISVTPGITYRIAWKEIRSVSANTGVTVRAYSGGAPQALLGNAVVVKGAGTQTRNVVFTATTDEIEVQMYAERTTSGGTVDFDDVAIFVN